MARIGRPKAENPRSYKLDVRLTEKEHMDLDAYAREHGLTKTQTVVIGIQHLLEMDKQKSLDL